MDGAAMFALAIALIAVKLFEQRRQIFNDALKLDLSAVNQLMAVRTKPFERVAYAQTPHSTASVA